MKKILALLSLFILFTAIKLPAEVTVYLDPGYSTDGKDIPLTLEGLMKPDFPRPKNHLPVLFVHGHNFGAGKNFRKNWQQSLNGLPSFRETLERPENARLGIEPYFIDLEDYKNAAEKRNRLLEEDAGKIKEAVELILLHQDDPAAKTKKVVIIAFSRGAISVRYFLKDLWQKQNKRLSYQPVSEFIAISPPNHGLNSGKRFIQTVGLNSRALQQLNNGRDENCNRFSDPAGFDFMEKLNGHPLKDSKTDNYCGQLFASEAPGSRSSNEPIEKGILYVTLYAEGNRDVVGGSEPSEDCQGRVLAKNLAPDAENIEVAGIPGGDNKLAVHQNSVHMPEIICKALYTTVYHRAPPDDFSFNRVDETDWKSPPVVPPLQMARKDAGIVLLFDISGSMSSLLPLVKRAAEPFIKLLGSYGNSKTNVGIAVFPALPWNREAECGSQVVHPMTSSTDTHMTNAVRTVNCLEAQGNTPLLNGIHTALQMVGRENRKTIILLSDGNHNCPKLPVSHQPSSDYKTNARRAIKSFDQTFTKGGWHPQPIRPPAGPPEAIKEMNEKQVVFHAIGLGPSIEAEHKFLGKLARDRREHLKGKFLRVIEPEIMLMEALTAVFAEALKLEEVTDSSGIIHANETKTTAVKVGSYDRTIIFLLNWVTPQEGRLGLKITSSDGEVVPTGSDNVHVHRGETYTIVTVAEDFLRQPGRVGAVPWNVTVNAPGLNAGEGEKYRCSILMDSPLKIETGFDKAAYETGDTITVTAIVTGGEARRPLAGLTDVTVEVTRPGEGIGNWYALNKVSAEELETIPGKIGNDSISPLQRKAMALTQKGKVVFPRRIGPVSLVMYDDGTHGDKTGGDGIYTAQFKDTLKEGTYRFRFGAAGDAFERQKKEQTYVTVNPDPGYSYVGIHWLDISRDNQVHYLYDVELVPKDRYGNYRGPGVPVAVNVVHKHNGDSSPSTRLTDNLDGTYRGEISISRYHLKNGAQLQFFIDGELFTTIEKIPRFKRGRLGISLGGALPAFSFDRYYNPGIHLGCSIGYRLTPEFSLLGTAGFNRFASNSSLRHDTEWWNISVNLKSEIVKSPLRLYVNVGPGIYVSKSGALKRGFNFGAGAAYSLASNWDIELGADFHHVFTRGLDPNFFLTYARMVYRF